MNEQDYISGEQAFARRIMGECIKTLPPADKAQWSLERIDVVAKLREICGEFGDNEWSDDLHIVDILDKHLQRHLEDK